METYIRKAEDLDAVNANFLPPLLDAILGDYNRNTPAARDAEVLNVMASIITRLGVSSMPSRRTELTDSASAIIDAPSTCNIGCCV